MNCCNPRGCDEFFSPRFARRSRRTRSREGSCGGAIVGRGPIWSSGSATHALLFFHVDEFEKSATLSGE